DFINTPVLTKIRKRETEHGGRTPDVAKESVLAYEQMQEEKKQEKQEDEIPPEPSEGVQGEKTQRGD
ncbi:MAG: hypothetical protein SXQ77_10515, partial [Halobacteria archaeon]|nr:hypothetical protein [Halobacteria archaeon]